MLKVSASNPPPDGNTRNVSCNLMKNLYFIICLFISNISFGQKYPSPDSVKILKQSRLDTILSLLKVNKGEIIADIGSGKGYNLIRLSKNFPDVSYYVQDIDAIQCNRNVFLKTLKTYNSNQNIDSFHFFKGTTSSTNLPKNYFDKVLLIAVVHEFTKTDSMLTDIKSILKENGDILIEEPLVIKVEKKEKGCNNPYLTEISFKEILERNKIKIIEEKYIKDFGINKYRKVFLCKKKGYS